MLPYLSLGVAVLTESPDDLAITLDLAIIHLKHLLKYTKFKIQDLTLFDPISKAASLSGFCFDHFLEIRILP